MFNEKTKHIVTKLFRENQQVYVFRVKTPPADIACDDLVQDELAALGVSIAADKPTPDEHLLIVTSNDGSVTPGHILSVLNGNHRLDAELLSKE